MHLLPCPSCQASIPVSPKQAGDQTHCPHCGASVAIPKLGELRRLPLDQQAEGPDTAAAPVETSLVRRVGFVVLGLIATASLVAAAFCGIRWRLVDVPSNTDDHVALYREQYKHIKAAELIREYEDMEKFGLDLAAPYKYKTAELEKNQWGRNASVAAAIAGTSILCAFILVGTGRRNRR